MLNTSQYYHGLLINALLFHSQILIKGLEQGYNQENTVFYFQRYWFR